VIEAKYFRQKRSGYFEGGFGAARESLRLPSPLLWVKTAPKFKYFPNYWVQEEVLIRGEGKLFSLVPRTV